MFKRGGGVSSKNNGIVQGFEEERQPFAPENTNRVAGGSVLEDFQIEEKKRKEESVLTMSFQSYNIVEMKPRQR